MIGDSYGVPNDRGPPGAPPEHHTEYLLREIKEANKPKYEVINLSINGSNNAQQASILEVFLHSRPDKKIDFVVWFHNTALTTVITPPTHVISVTKYMHAYLNGTYKRMALLKQRTGARWVVIGASSELPENYYSQPLHDYVIHDWRSQILKENLPQVFGAGVVWNRSIINSEYNIDSAETKNKMILDFEYVQNLVSKKRQLFPDGCHPGLIPHLALTKELDAYFSVVPPAGVEPAPCANLAP